MSEGVIIPEIAITQDSTESNNSGNNIIDNLTDVEDLDEGQPIKTKSKLKIKIKDDIATTDVEDLEGSEDDTDLIPTLEFEQLNLDSYSFAENVSNESGNFLQNFTVKNSNNLQSHICDEVTVAENFTTDEEPQWEELSEPNIDFEEYQSNYINISSGMRSTEHMLPVPVLHVNELTDAESLSSESENVNMIKKVKTKRRKTRSFRKGEYKGSDVESSSKSRKCDKMKKSLSHPLRLANVNDLEDFNSDNEQKMEFLKCPVLTKTMFDTDEEEIKTDRSTHLDETIDSENETDIEFMEAPEENYNIEPINLPPPVRTVIYLSEDKTVVPTTKILPLDENFYLGLKYEEQDGGTTDTEFVGMDEDFLTVDDITRAPTPDICLVESSSVYYDESKLSMDQQIKETITDTEMVSSGRLKRTKKIKSKSLKAPLVSEPATTDYEEFDMNDDLSNNQDDRPMTPYYMKESVSMSTKSSSGNLTSKNLLSVANSKAASNTPELTDVEDIAFSADEDFIPDNNAYLPQLEQQSSRVHIAHSKKLNLDAPNETMYLKGGSYRQLLTDVEDFSDYDCNLEEWDVSKKSASQTAAPGDAEQQVTPNYVTYESVLLRPNRDSSPAPTSYKEIDLILENMLLQVERQEKLFSLDLDVLENDDDSFVNTLQLLPQTDALIEIPLKKAEVFESLQEIEIVDDNLIEPLSNFLLCESKIASNESLTDEENGYEPIEYDALRHVYQRFDSYPDEIWFEGTYRNLSIVPEEDEDENTSLLSTTSNFQSHSTSSNQYSFHDPVPFAEESDSSESDASDDSDDDSSEKSEKIVKAEVKLLVKTTDNGREAIEIRSVREFVETSDAKSDNFEIKKTKKPFGEKFSSLKNKFSNIMSRRRFSKPLEKESQEDLLKIEQKPSFTLQQIFVRTPEADNNLNESKRFGSKTELIATSCDRFPLDYDPEVSLEEQSLLDNENIDLHANIPFYPCYNHSDTNLYSYKTLSSPHTNPFTETISNPFCESDQILKPYCNWLEEQSGGRSTTTERLVASNEETLLDKPLGHPLTGLSVIDDNLKIDLNTIYKQTNAFIQSESQPEPYDALAEKYTKKEPLNEKKTDDNKNNKNEQKKAKKGFFGSIKTFVERSFESDSESEKSPKKSKKPKKDKKKKTKVVEDSSLPPRKPKLPTPPLEPSDIDSIPFVETSSIDLPPPYKPPDIPIEEQIIPVTDLDAEVEINVEHSEVTPKPITPKPAERTPEKKSKADKEQTIKETQKSTVKILQEKEKIAKTEEKSRQKDKKKAKAKTVVVEEVIKSIEPKVFESEEFSIVIDPTKKESPKKSKETFTINIDESIEKKEKEIMTKSPILAEEKIIKPIVVFEKEEIVTTTETIMESVYEDVENVPSIPPDQVKEVTKNLIENELNFGGWADVTLTKEDGTKEIVEKQDKEISKEKKTEDGESKRKTSFFGLFKKKDSRKDDDLSEKDEEAEKVEKPKLSEEVVKDIEESQTFLSTEVEEYDAPAEIKSKEVPETIIATKSEPEETKSEGFFSIFKKPKKDEKIIEKKQESEKKTKREKKSEEKKVAVVLSEEVLRNILDSKRFLEGEIQNYHDVKDFDSSKLPEETPLPPDQTIKTTLEDTEESIPKTTQQVCELPQKEEDKKDVSKTSPGFFGFFKKSKKEESLEEPKTEVEKKEVPDVSLIEKSDAINEDKEKKEVPVAPLLEKNDAIKEEDKPIKELVVTSHLPESVLKDISDTKQFLSDEVENYHDEKPALEKPLQEKNIAESEATSTSFFGLFKKTKKEDDKVEPEIAKDVKLEELPEILEEQTKKSTAEVREASPKPGFFGLFKKSKKDEDEASTRPSLSDAVVKNMKDAQVFLSTEIENYEDVKPIKFEPLQEQIISKPESSPKPSKGLFGVFKKSRDDSFDVKLPSEPTEKKAEDPNIVETTEPVSVQKSITEVESAKSEITKSSVKSTEENVESSPKVSRGLFGIFKKSKRDSEEGQPSLSETALQIMNDTKSFLTGEVDNYEDVKPPKFNPIAEEVQIDKSTEETVKSSPKPVKGLFGIFKKSKKESEDIEKITSVPENIQKDVLETETLLSVEVEQTEDKTREESKTKVTISEESSPKILREEDKTVQISKPKEPTISETVLKEIKDTNQFLSDEIENYEDSKPTKITEEQLQISEEVKVEASPKPSKGLFGIFRKTKKEEDDIVETKEVLSEETINNMNETHKFITDEVKHYEDSKSTEKDIKKVEEPKSTEEKTSGIFSIFKKSKKESVELPEEEIHPREVKDETAKTAEVLTETKEKTDSFITEVISEQKEQVDNAIVGGDVKPPEVKTGFLAKFKKTKKKPSQETELSTEMQKSIDETQNFISIEVENYEDVKKEDKTVTFDSTKSKMVLEKHLPQPEIAQVVEVIKTEVTDLTKNAEELENGAQDIASEVQIVDQPQEVKSSKKDKQGKDKKGFFQRFGKKTKSQEGSIDEVRGRSEDESEGSPKKQKRRKSSSPFKFFDKIRRSDEEVKEIEVETTEPSKVEEVAKDDKDDLLTVEFEDQKAMNLSEEVLSSLDEKMEALKQKYEPQVQKQMNDCRDFLFIEVDNYDNAKPVVVTDIDTGVSIHAAKTVDEVIDQAQKVIQEGEQKIDIAEVENVDISTEAKSRKKLPEKEEKKSGGILSKLSNLLSGTADEVKSEVKEAKKQVEKSEEKVKATVQKSAIETTQKISEVKEDVSDLKAGLMEVVEKTGGKINDVGKKVAEDTQTTVQKITGDIDSVKKEAKYKSEHEKVKINVTIQETTDTIKDIKQGTTDFIVHKTDEFKENVKAASSSAVTEIEKRTNEVQKTKDKIIESTTTKTQEVKKDIETVAHKTTDKLIETKEAASKARTDFEEAVSKEADEIRKSAESAIFEVQNFAEGAKDDISDVANNELQTKKEVIKEKVAEVTKSVESKIDDLNKSKESTLANISKITETAKDVQESFSKNVDNLTKTTSEKLVSVKETTSHNLETAKHSLSNKLDKEVQDAHTVATTTAKKAEKEIKESLKTSGQVAKTGVEEVMAKVTHELEKSDQTNQTVSHKTDEITKKATEEIKVIDSQLTKLQDSLDQLSESTHDTTEELTSYVTAPTRRSKSQRLSREEGPTLREVRIPQKDEDSDDEKYTVTEPEDLAESKRKPLFHIESEDMADDDVHEIGKSKERRDSVRSNILETLSENKIDTLLSDLENQLVQDLERSVAEPKEKVETKVSKVENELETLKKDSQADVEQIEKKLRDLDKALDSLEQASDPKLEKKLHRVERKFERMASEVMDKEATGVSPTEVEARREHEFQKLVSQLSTEEVSEFQQEYTHLWDETTFSKSDDWDSKTPDSQVDVQDLPQGGEIVYMGPVTLNRNNLVNKAGVEVDVIPIMRSPCHTPRPTKKNKRARSAMDFYEDESGVTKDFDRGSLPDLKRTSLKGSLVSTIIKLNPDRFLYGSATSLRSTASSGSDLSKGEIMNAVLDWLDKSNRGTSSFEAASVASSDSNLSQPSGHSNSSVPVIRITGQKPRSKRKGTRETASAPTLTEDLKSIPQPKPRFAKETPIQFKEGRQHKLEKQISPVRDDLLDEDEPTAVPESYSDKKKFWENVTKDKRMSLHETSVPEKDLTKKRASVHEVPVPKPRSQVQVSQSIDEESVQETIMTEYQASFQPPSERKSKSPPKPDSDKESTDSESDNQGQGNNENAGYISDSGDVEHYISDSEIEDRVPQIRERQMSVFAPPVAAARKTIYERSASLPTEDLYEVSARSSKLRKQYYEEQIKKEMIEEQLTSEIEEEPSPERKALISSLIEQLNEEKQIALAFDEATKKEVSFEEDHTHKPDKVLAHIEDHISISSQTSETHKEVDGDSQHKRSSLGSEQSSSSDVDKMTRDGSTSKPDSMEVHVDKSEIEDSEKFAELDQDGTDLETKSLDSLNAIEMSPKSANFADDAIPEITVTLSGKQRRISEESDEYAPKKELESPIHVPEERIEDTVWEVSVQSQPEARFDEKVTSFDSATVEKIDKDDELSLSGGKDESDLGSEIHQDHSDSYASDKIKSESHSDIERIIMDSLQHQKVDPIEAKAIASALIEEIEAEIHRREAMPPTTTTGDVSDYLKYLAETKGLDEREVELVESVLARRQRELAKLSRGDTQASSIEITDEDLRYSGAEIDPSHVLEQQISQLKAEKLDDLKSMNFLDKIDERQTEESHFSKDYETVQSDGVTGVRGELHTKTLETIKGERSERKETILEEDETISESTVQEFAESQTRIEAVECESRHKKGPEKDSDEYRKTTADVSKEMKTEATSKNQEAKTGDALRKKSEDSSYGIAITKSIIKHDIDVTEKSPTEEVKLKGQITTEDYLSKEESTKIETSSEKKEFDGGKIDKERALETHHVKTLEKEMTDEEREETTSHTDEDILIRQSKTSSKVTSTDVTKESFSSVEVTEKTETVDLDSSLFKGELEESKVIIEKHEEIKRTSSSESKSSVESGKSPEDQFSTCSSGRKGDSDSSKNIDKPEVLLRKASSLPKGDRKSGLDFETYSSSGESHYHSFELDSGKSRPCSSDVEGLIAAGSSEYESALTSQDFSIRSHVTSTEYQTAVSSLSSKESMKSLDSESSGHLGSVEVSELSETLVPSASDAEGDILDAADHLDDVGWNEDIPDDQSDTQSKMKRSHEMTFQPEPKLLLADSPHTDDVDKKFVSMDDGSVISMSLSSTSGTEPRTVIELSRADSERGGSMTVSGISDQLSIEGSCDSLVFQQPAATTTDMSTSTGHSENNLQIESITFTTSMVNESGIRSVSTQVISQSQSIDEDRKKNEEVQNNGTCPPEVKRKTHRRQESTSSFVPPALSSLEQKLHSELTESDKYTAELSFKEVASDEKKDVDEREKEESYETEADQGFHRDIREGKYQETEDEIKDDTPEFSSETQASVGELEQEYTSALARAQEAKKKESDLHIHKEPLEKRDSHGKSSSTSSEKSSFEEAEADAAFNMVAHVSPAHKIKQICPILEDEDAEKHELETREKAQKEYEKRRSQLREQSPGAIPDIKVTQHMTPLVDRNFRYPELELEEQERAKEKEKEEKEKASDTQKSTPQTPSSKSSEDTDQGQEYVLEDSGISIPDEGATESKSTVLEQTVKEEADKDTESPNSDSFEMLEKPDLIDDFVVIEEVAKEAHECDAEGKSMSIQPKPRQKRGSKHDEEVEAYLAHSAPTPLTKMTDVKFYPDGSSSEELGFDFEDSPPINTEAAAANYEKELEANKKWIEQQFQGDQAARLAAGYDYEMEFERGPLEDIKEEDINDFDPTSSRIGSVGSQKESGGSLGSVKDSYSSTPEYDVLAGRKYFTRSGEHDDVSMSSLQEFENLERAMSLETKRYHGSQDSSSNGSFKTRYYASKSGQGDDVSVSSLKEFEGLEMACIAAHKIETKAKEEEAMLAQIEEGQESIASESESCETVSRTDKKIIPDSDEEDYEKRMFEIDEIIRQAQTNVERFIDLKEADKTESLGRGDSIEEVSKVPDLDLDAPVVRSTVKVQWKEGDDAMVTSTDSIDGKPEEKGSNNDSTDSLDQKTCADIMTASTDSIEFQMKKPDQINLLSDSIEIKDEACGMISSDSLELGAKQSENMLESTDSLVDPTSSTATHATYQFETDSVFSGSFTSGGSNTMVSSTDTIDPVQVDIGAAARKVWFDEEAGKKFTSEFIQDSGKPYVTEVIEPSGEEDYSYVIHRKVELPAEIRKITFTGSDADERLKQYIEDFNEGEHVEEIQEVDAAGNVHTKRVVQRRFIVTEGEGSALEDIKKAVASKTNQLTSFPKEATGGESSVAAASVNQDHSAKAQPNRRRQLRYEISVDDQIEVDPREHDWRFKLPEHAEGENSDGKQGGSYSSQQRSVSDQHQLSEEMKELLKELERDSKQ